MRRFIRHHFVDHHHISARLTQVPLIADAAANLPATTALSQQLRWHNIRATTPPITGNAISATKSVPLGNITSSATPIFPTKKQKKDKKKEGSATTLDAVVLRHIQSGDWNGAVEAFIEAMGMGRGGCHNGVDGASKSTPNNAVSYTVTTSAAALLLHTLEKHGDTEGAMSIIDALVSFYGGPSSPSSSPTPSSAVTTNSVNSSKAGASFAWDAKLCALAIRIQCRRAVEALEASNGSSPPPSSSAALVGAAATFQWLVGRNEVRHRSLSPYLQAVCAVVERSTAAATTHLPTVNYLIGFAQQQQIALEEADYAAILRAFAAVSTSTVSSSSPPASAVPLSYLHHLLTMMQVHVNTLEDTATVAALKQWAGSSIVAEVILNEEHATIPASSVESASSSSGGGSEHKRLVSASCSRCNARLVGHPFTRHLRDSLLKTMITKVVPTVTRRNPKAAQQAFDSFTRYIHTRTDANVYIDGANVGYYGLSKWYGVAKEAKLRDKEGLTDAQIAARRKSHPEDFVWDSKKRFVDVPPSFELIDLVLTELTTNPTFAHYNFRPLIFLHKRHVEERHLLSKDKALFTSWLKRGLVYCSPDGINDDLCWLYSCFYHTTPTDASAGAVGTQNFSGPSQNHQKKQVYIVTNDLMRDHIFQLFDRQTIGHFRDRARVGLTCSFEELGKTSVRFAFPSPYTNCIQFDSGKAAWHIPTCVPQQPSKTHSHLSLMITDGSAEAIDGEGDCVGNDDVEEGRIQWLCVR